MINEEDKLAYLITFFMNKGFSAFESMQMAGETLYQDALLTVADAYFDMGIAL